MLFEGPLTISQPRPALHRGSKARSPAPGSTLRFFTGSQWFPPSLLALVRRSHLRSESGHAHEQTDAPDRTSGQRPAPRSSLVSREASAAIASTAGTPGASYGTEGRSPRSGAMRHRGEAAAPAGIARRDATSGTPPAHRSPGAFSCVDLGRKVGYTPYSGGFWFFASGHSARLTRSTATFFLEGPPKNLWVGQPSSSGR